LLPAFADKEIIIKEINKNEIRLLIRKFFSKFLTVFVHFWLSKIFFIRRFIVLISGFIIHNGSS
ncbi:MAG: hypothetical protein ACRDE5_07710, partial [Ginsengibacter sp.]